MEINASKCVHPLKDGEPIQGAATAAILPAISYQYLDGGELKYPGFYSTYNQKRLGLITARLERAEWGVAFSSGMAAITTAILSFIKAGDHIVFLRELYGGTLKFATDELPKRGITCSFAALDIESIRSSINDNTRIIYIESPSNPLLNILPLDEIVSMARQRNIITIIDNTFASPINQVPIAHGFDVAAESGTKYLGGHNDLPFGTLAGNSPAHYEAILATAKIYGGSLTPYECYLAERSIKTLAVRVEKQNRNAQIIAEYLEKDRSVVRVYYPGLQSHPQYQLATKQMSGFGGMISFELKTGDIRKFQQRLQLITPALSLGGVESLICSPMLTSHRYLSGDERMQLGISDSLLRLSVGIEDPHDLVEDLRQALTGS